MCELVPGEVRLDHEHEGTRRAAVQLGSILALARVTAQLVGRVEQRGAHETPVQPGHRGVAAGNGTAPSPPRLPGVVACPHVPLLLHDVHHAVGDVGQTQVPGVDVLSHYVALQAEHPVVWGLADVTRVHDPTVLRSHFVLAAKNKLIDFIRAVLTVKHHVLSKPGGMTCDL